jgi:hypothetical protein
VLGLEDVEVTPAQLARAYFRLAAQLDEVPVVRRGLEGSIAYGMAHNAATPGLTIAGKTGTASDAGQAWTHGWFAGIASRGAERVVVVVYVPRGNGADAAGMAHRFFAALGADGGGMRRAWILLWAAAWGGVCGVAQEQDPGARQLAVEVFSARRIAALTVMPIGKNESVRSLCFVSGEGGERALHGEGAGR